MSYAAPYGQQQPHHYAPTPPPRRSLAPWLFLAVALVVAGTASWFAYDRFIRKDPGVAACQALRDGGKTFTGKKADDTKMTEAEYREMRAVFESSRHEDIRDHGTKLMDIAWQISNMGEEPGLGALAFVGPLTEHVSGLQSACADQGIIVDMQLGK